ncbi:hypothetical protein F5B21DRAFT_504924 [Xylaria acuta]|nr:hypothetical protein F5B21DRAFT_504924 [Xylaria acuta]
MSAFDPTKPIDDPSVWYPQGMYVQQEKRDGEGPVFVLAQTDMASLNRYAWTGKLLPVTRDEYTLSLGISDGSEISEPVWGAVDLLLGKYSTMKTDTSQFLDITWPSIVDLSNNIYNFSALAGGKDDSSYYASMLKWVGMYNDETDPDKKEEYRQSIQQITKTMYDKTQTLHDKAEESKQALIKFEEATRTSQVALTSSSSQLSDLLEGEDGEITELKDQISQSLKDIEAYQKEIDADRLTIEQTAYYVWIPFAGTIAAVSVLLVTENDIHRLEKAIKTVRDTINQEKAKLQAAMRLQSDITSMSMQVDKLVDLFGPVITTLEMLQGAWEKMGSDLNSLNELFNDQGTDIPPMLMEQIQLNQIIDQWNALKNCVDQYRQNAYLSDQPSKESLDDYLAELQVAKKA